VAELHEHSCRRLGGVTRLVVYNFVADHRNTSLFCRPKARLTIACVREHAADILTRGRRYSTNNVIRCA
jgi:hypothetical protein